MDNKKFLNSFVPRASFYLWVIFILIGAITYFNWRMSIPLYLILIMLVYYNYRSNHLRRREITKYIENLTFNIDSATKDTLLNFPMPLVVKQLSGIIPLSELFSKERRCLKKR
jgi:cyclic-di-AMP phosphodiesterase